MQLQVQCVLQYWNVIDRSYHDYGRLWLREGEGSGCRLPATVEDGAVMSEVWRIVIEDQSQKMTLESLSAAGLRFVEQCFILCPLTILFLAKLF